MTCWKALPKCSSEPFLYLYMLALGANLSVLPQLTVSKLCHKKYNNTVCSNLGSKQFKLEENVVFKEAATWNTVIFLSVYIPAMFGILPTGALSDLVCKRRILLLPPVATILQCILFICCARYQSMHVGLLAFGASMTSSFGDIQGTVMMAYTYMAGVTKGDNHRTLRMAILEGSLFLGQGLGSYAAGILLKTSGFEAAFLFSLSASLANILFIVLLLPEIPKSEGGEVNDSENFQPISAICRKCLGLIKQANVNVIVFAKKYFPSPRGRVIVLLLAAAFLVNSAVLGESVIITLFVKHSPLRLSPQQIGLYYFILHTTRGIGICILAVIAAKLFKPSDCVVITIGLCSLIATHTSLAFATTKEMLYGFTMFSIAFPYAMSGIRAYLTKMVTYEEHGTALSFVALVSLIGVNIMTFAANALFKATAQIFPGFSILLLSSASFIALFIIASLFFITRKSEEKNNLIEEKEELEGNELHPLLEQRNESE
eukprot:Seg965.2 transcript_id=Seg965.2/GoldUCD/mRNA.D3Y31 product="Proton-coupled folate transporter" protein_id=Seg965.2/GoldUCD/D3Y31